VNLVWLFSLLAFLVVGCATTRPQPLTSADIISMTAAGMTGEAIIHRIADTQTVFRLADADVERLRQAGVSERVVKYLLDTYVRFSVSEQRRTDIENEEWHSRYGLWYGR